MSKRIRFLPLVVPLLFVALSHQRAAGHDGTPGLTPEEIQQYRDDGTFDERAALVDRLKQYRMSSDRAKLAAYKIKKASLEAAGLDPNEVAGALLTGPQAAFPFTAKPELRSHGTVKTLTVLIDFPDEQADDELPGLTVDAMRDNIYGTGTEAAENFAPHESLNAYYKRASEGKLDVQGNILENRWHRLAKDMLEYPPDLTGLTEQQAGRAHNKALFDMISPVLKACDARGHDFAQYDNDNDGDIDLLTVLYAGPDTGWGSFYWAYRWEFFIGEANAAANRLDGKRVKQFVFQFVETRDGGEDYDPTTLLHETGHALGLADYYDYDDDIGPPGGVGGLDMMHANAGNHCAFSRWLLDWIEPRTIGSGSPQTIALRPSCSTASGTKAIAIFPGLAAANAPGGEMFIVEYRDRTGNDSHSDVPGEGLLVWHVNATPNGSGDDFVHDNSFTDRKLIRLVRADNPSDFGPVERATAQTYYLPPRKFTPTSNPPSRNVDGDPTGVSIVPEGVSGGQLMLKAGFVSGGGAAPQFVGPPPAPEDPQPQATPPQPAPPEEADVNSLSAGDLATRLASGEDRDPLASLEALRLKTQELTAADLEALVQTSLASQNENSTPAGQAASKLLSAQWAAKQGEQAVETLVASESELAAEIVPLAMEAWAGEAPDDAFAWYFSDKGAKLRQAENNSAGIGFARKAFAASALQDFDKACGYLDQLPNEAEAFGAIEALQSVGQDLKKPAEEIEAAIEQGAGTNEWVDEARQFQNAIKKLNSADPKVREMLRERARFQLRD